MLDRITTPWTWLERTLNTIVEQVNRQHPISSTTVAIEESPNGTLFKVATTQQTDQASSSMGRGGGTTQPPAQQVIWHNVAWQQVTVVDPATCAQSAITVLIQKPGASLVIQ